jgi:hypothetical protein
MTDTTPPASTDALQKLFPWLAYMPGWAPEQLVQPINQGWTFGNVMITTQNSSAPGIEHAIASKVSYGRQIGRLMDAMEVLVRMLPPDARQDDAITDFVALAKEVRKVKDEAQAQRLDRLKADLETLKREDPQGWKNLLKGLRP